MRPTIYRFETANFVVVMTYQDDPKPDTSFDETGETQSNIESGKWGCYRFTAEALHKPTGLVLGEDNLSGCIYAKPEEFRDHVGAQGRYGSYFRDMIGNVCQQAREQLAMLQATHTRTA